MVKRGSEDDGIPVSFYETNIYSLENMVFHGEHWYYTELDHIVTSMSDTWIRIHFKAMPVDGNGLPLIPDEENYKEALYYYVRAKMIGAGYEDRQFREDVLMDRFEKYAQRARSRITYPSLDQMEEKVGRMNKLIFPENYWNNYFV